MSQHQRMPLTDWRKSRGWSQFQLAKEADTSLSSIVNIERGRQEPRVALAQKIARALGVAVEDIAWPSVAEGTKRVKNAA